MSCPFVLLSFPKVLFRQFLRRMELTEKPKNAELMDYFIRTEV
jgi:hypothetical protein